MFLLVHLLITYKAHIFIIHGHEIIKLCKCNFRYSFSNLPLMEQSTDGDITTVFNQNKPPY